jgi:hypothetical protein
VLLIVCLSWFACLISMLCLAHKLLLPLPLGCWPAFYIGLCGHIVLLRRLAQRLVDDSWAWIDHMVAWSHITHAAAAARCKHFCFASITITTEEPRMAVWLVRTMPTYCALECVLLTHEKDRRLCECT